MIVSQSARWATATTIVSQKARRRATTTATTTRTRTRSDRQLGSKGARMWCSEQKSSSALNRPFLLALRVGAPSHARLRPQSTPARTDQGVATSFEKKVGKRREKA